MVTNKKLSLILIGIALACVSFGLSVMPIILVSGDGVDTDSILTQQFFRYDKTVFDFGFNLKRAGLSVGYITPYLMEGIVVHGGVYFDYIDVAQKKFNPKFSFGLTVRW
jgi:hypothetical protein